MNNTTIQAVHDRLEKKEQIERLQSELREMEYQLTRDLLESGNTSYFKVDWAKLTKDVVR